MFVVYQLSLIVVLILCDCNINVFRGLVFEEEDFQPTLYGYHLTPDVNEQRALSMLREVEDEFSRKLRSKPGTECPEEVYFNQVHFVSSLCNSNFVIIWCRTAVCFVVIKTFQCLPSPNLLLFTT